MHILILGGTNDLPGCLDDYIKKRCDKAIELIKDIHTCIVHFSGGFNDRFNKMKNNISQSELCMKYFLENITNFDKENMLFDDQRKIKITSKDTMQNKEKYESLKKQCMEIIQEFSLFMESNHKAIGDIKKDFDSNETQHTLL